MAQVRNEPDSSCGPPWRWSSSFHLKGVVRCWISPPPWSEGACQAAGHILERDSGQPQGLEAQRDVVGPAKLLSVDPVTSERLSDN